VPIPSPASRSRKALLFRLGTRGSPLALAQTRELKDRLIAAHGLDPHAIEIVAIKTSGDMILNLPLSEAGGKGLFTKELDLALASGDIEMAVHSAKDLPTILPAGIEIAGYLPRADVRDAWISPHAPHPLKLPLGSLVGTASLRRGAMVRRLRPDLKIALLRGNVETRLAKVAKGEVAATLLALAGLKRLGLEAAATAAAPVPPISSANSIWSRSRVSSLSIEDQSKARKSLSGAPVSGCFPMFCRSARTAGP